MFNVSSEGPLSQRRSLARNVRLHFLYRQHTHGVSTGPGHFFKGELRSEISILHMKVLTLIKAKSNVFL